MPLIISEIVVDSSGRMAIELHNNDVAGSIDIQNYSFSLSGSGTASFTVTTSHAINAGDFFTIGHSSFSGMDLTGFDAQLSPGSLGGLLIRNAGLGPVDTYGRFSGPVNAGNDISVQAIDLNRTPDTSISTDNSSEFSQQTASNNTLGAACFLKGTMIATPDGERAVQDLAAGDLVMTADGRAVPVVWLGEQLVKKRIGMVPEGLEPVCIKAGALGNHSDLYVTADHGMIVGGYLVNAGALVNGDSIAWAPYGAAYTVYHVETEAHEVLLANGARAESFVDVVDRRAFDNAGDGVARIIREMDVPRISTARLLPIQLRAA